MTDQQQHLTKAIEQQKAIALDLEKLNSQTLIQKEMFLKLQGVIEYLTQLGVTVPEVSETSETSTSKED